MLLMLAVALPFLTPFLALGQTAESGLPACCRRNGVHHCAMGMDLRGQLADAESATPALKAPPGHCPYCPSTAAGSHTHHAAGVAGEVALAAGLFSHPAGVVQTECKRRIAQDRSRQKRGPPTLLA